jgi:hypothetical protein
VRFALAVVVSAAAQLFVYLRLSDWIGLGALLAVTYIAFAALGAGWFAARRGALAGALSVAGGVALYALVTFFGPAGVGMQAFDLVFGVLRLVVAYWPYMAIGALAGAVGGSLRARVVGAR